MKKNIIVVDGYSTGNLYAPQFTAKGYTVHHIQSSETIIDIFKPSFKEHDYASNFVFDGDVDALYTHVRSLAPAVILPGAESGVDLSEELCIAFNLFANDAALLDNRKSKAKMNDALKRQGMLTAKQHCFTAIDCLENWLGELDELDWPVVLKPIDSVASDGLFICNSYKECISAANSLLNKDNLLGKKNTSILAQSYLYGAQYIVNVISRDGQHSVTDVWYTNRTRFERTKQILEDRVLLSPSNTPVTQLSEYVVQSLQALGINNGASHVEVMMTAEGPAMIEVNRRPMGGAMPIDLFNAALGTNHTYRMLDLYLAPSTASLKEIIDYDVSQFIAIVDFTFQINGEIQHTKGLTYAQSLPSFHSIINAPKLGQQVFKTEDTIAGQGVLCLAHPDQAQLMVDLQVIRQLKSNGELFGVISYAD
ncbi:ATP-grasp domain-containing protein [Photobacterium leiognathi]|uniref:ATP-grasp domain-containing protein n=1 Tax=Photobacterium leiognathi TaxID=553611 RepID=UPI00298196E7|nr:ATP-grasp domain-containing protein [Photobacterium leiognathi]